MLPLYYCDGTYIIQDNEMVSPSTLHVADSKEKALVVQSWDQLLGEEGQQYAADCGKVEVMDHEG